MRGFVLVMFTLFIHSTAQARCMGHWASAWPEPGKPLPANGRILLEGYGAWRDPVLDLEARHPVLVSGRERVPVKVVDRFEGELKIGAIMLQPEHPLTVGARYRLVLEGKRGNREVFGATQPTRKGEVPWSWPVAAADEEGPTWATPPAVLKGTREELGCGPASSVEMDVSALDNADFRVLAEVTPQGGGPTVRYPVQVREGKVELGHNMCSGPFMLAAGKRYTARLWAMDLAGHKAALPTGDGTVELLGPVENPPQ
jgi:hypothetical protein